MRVRLLERALVWWLISCGLSAVSAVESAESAPLVQALISTAGPYGQNWYLTLTPDAEVSLQVFYNHNPSGTLLARFQLGQAHLEGLRGTLQSERFFDLPASIAPTESPLHMPDLRLAVTLDGRTHKVNLYNPSALTKDTNAKRFLASWNRLFEALPLRPSW